MLNKYRKTGAEAKRENRNWRIQAFPHAAFLHQLIEKARAANKRIVLPVNWLTAKNCPNGFGISEYTEYGNPTNGGS